MTWQPSVLGATARPLQCPAITMKRSFLLASALLLASFTAACTDDDDDGSGGETTTIAQCAPQDFERPDLELIDVTGLRSPTTGSASAGTPSAADDRAHDAPATERAASSDLGDASAACECVDEACVIDWIETNLGCDVCVRLACDDGSLGGCLPCPAPTPGEPDDGDTTVDATGDTTPCVAQEREINAPALDIQVDHTDASGARPAGEPTTFRPEISRRPAGEPTTFRPEISRRPR